MSQGPEVHLWEVKPLEQQNKIVGGISYKIFN